MGSKFYIVEAESYKDCSLYALNWVFASVDDAKHYIKNVLFKEGVIITEDETFRHKAVCSSGSETYYVKEMELYKNGGAS
jgi:hypothetical protein